MECTHICIPYMEYTYEVVPLPKSLQYINETKWREGRDGCREGEMEYMEEL